MASLQIKPPLLLTAGAIWPPVCVAVVAARFWTRKAQKGKLGVDDWLTLPALILVLGMAATILAGVAQHGLGYPTPKSAPDEALTAMSPQQTVTRKAYAATTSLQTAALAFIKLSCMCFYYRIFGNVRAIRIVVYIMNSLIIIWGCGFFFSFLFGCGVHFDFLWTNLQNQLSCPTDLTAVDLGLAISDVIMDAIILVLPLPIILRLQMSIGNKLAVMAIFVLGSLAIAASIARLAILVEVLQVEFAATADEDFVSTDAIYFMYIEACFALTAICLPTLSGALKLKAVQAMISGFSAVFSNISLSSSRSRSSRSVNRSKDHERLDSLHSEPSHSVAISGTHPGECSDVDLEMYPLPKQQVIKVTKMVDQTSTMK